MLLKKHGYAARFQLVSIHARGREGADLQGTLGVENNVVMNSSIVARCQILKEGMC